MIYRDVSAIVADQNDCNYLSSDKQIYGFSNSYRTRKVYVLIEDKYYLSSTSTQTQPYNVANYNCLTDPNLTTLTSSSNAFVPFYGFVAISLSICVLCIVWFAIKSILGRRV